MGQLKAILFDLDGTLIDVDLEKFIQGYLNLLANSLAYLIPTKKVVRALLKTSEIINRNDGKITNEEAFINYFFPIEGYGWEDLQPIFDKFYENIFPELRKFTIQTCEIEFILENLDRMPAELVSLKSTGASPSTKRPLATYTGY